MSIFTKNIKSMEDPLIHGLQDIYYVALFEIAMKRRDAEREELACLLHDRIRRPRLKMSRNRVPIREFM